MPYIKIMNLNKEQMTAVVENTKRDIAKIVGIPESRFHFFHCGELILEDYLVLIEILWYPRDKNKMKSVAELFDNEVKKHGDYEAHVVFHELSDKHYINGEQHIHKPD